ncbi:MAG: tetratricopeptide repeat protein [Thermoguttaceae bacterium]|nr:tetratricopeptide repeat protein [Thermoguttaceae bacterium]MDW8077768.1 tetratricopeptide repeat protein [Thermoguttaceae bacterium]
MKEALRIGSEHRGRYRVQRQIATGGTSCVYLLRDFRLNRDVVLKQGIASDRYKIQDLREIFANEDRILGRLNGRFAPRRYEFLPDELELYMEYCPGKTLDTYLQGWILHKKFPPDDKLIRLAATILEAVQACHEAGVIVADLKPRNIQLGRGAEEGEVSVTLLDFGSAWLTSGATMRHGVDYTVGYGAPELLKGQTPTEASDLYSFGAILFALFAQREPGLEVPPRDFADRRTLVLPALQELVLQLTEEEPSCRPTLQHTVKALHDCLEDLVELSRAKWHCPKCQQLIPDQSARFCRHCGAKVSRETIVLTDVHTRFRDGADPISQMLECLRVGELMNALFWAKKARELSVLTTETTVIAVETALQVPGQSDFAYDLALSIASEPLTGDLKRRYLVCLAQVLKAKKINFAPFQDLFADGVKNWPREEWLWLGLYFASPAERSEEILREALRHNLESSMIRRELGWVLFRKGARAEALAIWVDAVQLGDRDPRFLRGVFQLAKELEDRHHAEILREIILGQQPRDSAEALALADFAYQEGCISKALELVDKGLSHDPYDSSLRRFKAKILFSQHKYELVLELQWMKDPQMDVELRTIKGRSLYELGRYLEAAQELCAILRTGKGTPETWYYLVRCYQRLGKFEHAREALREARKAFPNDELLRLLAERER